MFLKLSSLLPFTALFLLISTSSLCFSPPLPFPHFPHVPPSFLLYFAKSPFFTIFFLSALLSFYAPFFPLFSIFISPPLSSLLSPFLCSPLILFFPLPSSLLSCPPLSLFSSSFSLHPQLSLSLSLSLPPFLPPSLLSLCFCACCCSILCRELSCDANYID